MTWREWEKWHVDDLRADVLSYWDAYPLERKPVHTAFAAELRDMADGSLLDFGCGTGEDAPALASMCSMYVGADITEQMLVEARRRRPGLRFEHDDILCSRMGDDSFDVVVCNAVLPHLPHEEITTAIGEMVRISRKRVIVGLFGVTPSAERPTTITRKGFIYQKWPIQKWTALLDWPRVYQCGNGFYVLAHDKNGALS